MNKPPIICPLCEHPAGEWVESEETTDKCCTECAHICVACDELIHPDDGVGAPECFFCHKCLS